MSPLFDWLRRNPVVPSASWPTICTRPVRHVKPRPPTGSGGQSVHNLYIRLLITFGKCSLVLKIVSDGCLHISLVNDKPPPKSGLRDARNVQPICVRSKGRYR